MSTLAASRQRVSRPNALRFLVLLGGAGVLGLLSGRLAVSHYGTDAIAALIGIPVLIYLWPRPLLATLLAMALMGIVAYDQIPRVSLPGHPPLNAYDVLVAVIVLGTLWRRPWRTWPVDARRFALALVLVLAVAVIPTLPLLSQGHDAARQAILGYKNVLYLALGLTVAVEFSGRLWPRLLDGAIALAALLSVLSLAAAASGSVAGALNHFAAGTVLTGSAGGVGSARVRLSGLFFLYAMTIPTLAMALLVRDRWRWWRALAVVLELGAVGVSFNRNMYFGLIIGLMAAVIIGGPRLRHRLLIALAVLAASATIVLESAVLPAVTSKVETRATSALSSQVLQSSSLQIRGQEFAQALTSIRAHPWVGVGWMQFYGNYQSTSSGNVQRLYVEDLYLHLATDYGIPFLIAFLGLAATLLWLGVRRARQSRDPLARALIGAGVGALIAMLLSCLVGTYLQDENSTAMFGVVCGLLVAAGLQASPRLRRRPPAQDVPSSHRGQPGRGGPSRSRPPRPSATT